MYYLNCEPVDKAPAKLVFDKLIGHFIVEMCVVARQKNVWLCFCWCLILYCPFSHEMSWMRCGTELSQFLRIFYVLSHRGSSKHKA